MMLRVGLNVLVLVSVVALPWWVTLALLVGLVATSRAWEVLVWGFVLDALYSAPLPAFYNLQIVFTLICAGLFIAAEVLKPYLVFYER